MILSRQIAVLSYNETFTDSCGCTRNRTRFVYPTIHIYSVLGGFVLMNSNACESSNINKTKLKSQELNVKYEVKHGELQEYLRICEYNVSVSLFWVGVWVYGASRWTACYRVW